MSGSQPAIAVTELPRHRLWSARQSGWVLAIGLTVVALGTGLAGHWIRITPVVEAQVVADGEQSRLRPQRDHWRDLADPIAVLVDNDDDGQADERIDLADGALLPAGLDERPAIWAVYPHRSLWSLLGRELRR